MNRLYTLITALLLAACSLAVSAAQAGDAGTPHYPDLQTLAPTDVHIQKDRSTGTRFLRFSNTVANLGQGRLEVMPINNAATGLTDAYQRVYTHNASGVWLIQNTVYAGTFAFHPEHGHWHFEGFALYELRGVAADGSIGTQVFGSSGKVSFCMLDTTRVTSTIEHSSPKTYSTCPRDQTQGISVGWADTYGWRLAGQSIDVSNVPDGTYWLVSTADPEDRLLETNDSNNAAAIRVAIKGNRATVLK